MRKRLIAALLCLLLTLPLAIPVSQAQPAAPASDALPESSPQYRALLIACDEFVNYPDTTPIAHNNLKAMESILSADIRNFTIRLQDGITLSVEALEAAILDAFSHAQDQDISYLYISTHGDFLPDYSNPEGELILSDGSLEDRISAQALQAILDNIPGTKVLLIDACNAGALINKGVSPAHGPERMASTFTGDSYRALVSSGGSEPSWYWTSGMAQQGPPLGSSYFTTALVHGAGLYGDYPADKNQDGQITLQEMYQYLLINHAASTPQAYPQYDDDFVLFAYDPLTEQANTAALSGIVFDRTVLSAQQPTLNFSFTASQALRIGYQMVYLRDGVWDWSQATSWLDSEESPDARDGSIEPGRKHRTLTLGDLQPTDWGYVLFNMIHHSEDGPVIYASRILAVQPEEGDPDLSIQVAQNVQPSPGKELPIFVAHTLPCALTLTLVAEDGTLIRRLATARNTRPQGLSPNGSLFYWDGLDQDGQVVPPGTYTLQAHTQLDQRYEAQTSFTLQRGNGSNLP